MQTAIAAIFVFLLVILLHELGHFTVAKLVGIKVNEFSIGMGPKIIQRQKGETKYTLRILPIGGYVNMEGEDEDSDDPRGGFGKASPLARMAVVAAGAIMNFVLALIVLSIFSFNTGEPTTVIGEIIENTPAEVAGILPGGDRITHINHISVNTWEELSEAISSSELKEDMEVSILRSNEDITINIVPVSEEGRNIIGIIPRYKKNHYPME